MKEQSLLVTFCNQTISPQQSGALFALDGEGCSWLRLDEPGILAPGNDGLCGACRLDGDVVLATQSTPPLLILYDPIAGRIKATRDMSPCLDLHSVVYHETAVYVVSTGTNEIYKVPCSNDGFGTPRLHWRYPGVEHDRDLVHLNGLTVSADGLIASCFGPRQPNGTWGSEGAIFRIDPYQIIQGQLRQPHTPLCSGDRLFFAESRGHRVHSLHRDASGAWCVEQPIDVGGYARGLACREGKLWVGLSAPRRVSRSTGIPNQGIEAANSAGITCIDLATRTVIARRAFDGLGEEIYDLLIVDETGAPGRLVDALTQRTAGAQTVHIEMSRWLQDMKKELEANREQTAELERMLKAERALAENIAQALETERALVENIAQALQTERAHTEKMALALQAERAYAEKIAQQLCTVTGSRLWRAAQWLRRLAARAPFLPDIARPGASANLPAIRSMAEVYREIYAKNDFSSGVACSGTGPEVQQTTVIRETLASLLSDRGIRTMLDIPCGDFRWMDRFDLDIDYTGADVVPDLIAANTASYANDRRRFQVCDITKDTLPCFDLVLCRDLFPYLSFRDALRAIANLKGSGSTWLLTTTFPSCAANLDIETGPWRPINLQLPPFNFPPPPQMIKEDGAECGTDWPNRSLGLWRLEDL